MIHQLELTPRAQSPMELLDELRGHSAVQPFVEIEVSESRLVILTRSNHIGELFDTLVDVGIVVQAIPHISSADNS